MNKSVLLAAAAALALTAGGASAAQHPSAGVVGAKVTPIIHKAPAGAKMLYNQNSNTSGEGLLSSNFTSGSFPSASSAGADDFVVPKKRQWTVTEVDTTGIFFNGSGPATSVDVTFYSDSNNMPGSPVKNGTFTGLTCSGSPSFACTLGKGVKLKSGTYWVSVVTNQNFGGGAGEWGWELNSTIHGNPAMWENPGGYFGVCSTWGTVGSCLGYTGDFAFDLQGKSKKK